LVSLGKKLSIPEEFQGFLKKLSPQYFLARYPDASEDVPFELYDKELAEDFFKKIKGGISMDKEIIEIVDDFSNKVKKKFPNCNVIFFGSRAREDNFNTSDFDFLIISDDFKNIPFIFRASELYDLWSGDVDFEAICYTVEEFEKKKKEQGIVKKAIQEGIVL
jgi:predicted nucleotidyltransferase